MRNLNNSEQSHSVTPVTRISTLFNSKYQSNKSDIPLANLDRRCTREQ